MNAYWIDKFVKELLDKMVDELPGFRWDSLYTSEEEQGSTMVELNLFRRDGQEAAGMIAYQLKTGEVHRFNYKPIQSDASEMIVDFLLDVYNLERTLSEAVR
ncbi:MAG: hypothetical protein RLZZ165_2140 [Bacteroidota bacterium]|jgi:hypothetical protein